MHYDEVIRHIERVAAGGIDQQGARRASAATLATLAECLPRETASRLAAQLPREMQTHLTGVRESSQPLSLNQFLQRVAEREEHSPSEALHHARAVLDALAHATTGHELHDVRAHLPEEFATLFSSPAAAGWPEARHPRPHA